MKKTKRRLFIAALMVIVPAALFHGAVAFASNFAPLGGLHPTTVESEALAVSDDGSVVAGWSRDSSMKYQAFRWTADGGMAGLGFWYSQLSSRESRAKGISSDGTKIVGWSNTLDGSQNLSRLAIDWTEGSYLTNIDATWSEAVDVSPDGQMPIGSTGSSDSWKTPTYWNGGSAVDFLVAYFSGGWTRGEGVAVSGDNSLVAGWIHNPSLNETRSYIVTTLDNVQTDLGDLPGSDQFPWFTQVRDLSFDGSTAVGRSDSGDGLEPFRWTAAEGIQSIGNLPPQFSDFQGCANAVSADGSVIVGYSEGEAFVWDAINGIRKVSDVLAANGVVEAANWTLLEAMDVSADGDIVVGFGTNPNGNKEAWLARLNVVVPIVHITAPQDGAVFPPDYGAVDFAADATDADDGDVSADLQWSSDVDGALGVGATASAELTPGAHVVTAMVTNLAGRTGEDSIHVIVGSTPSVTITTPTDPLLFGEGDQIDFTAVADDPEDGNLSDAVQWSSNLDGAIGTGASTSAVLSVGVHDVAAEVMDSTGLTASHTISITVENLAPDVSITAPPDGSTFNEGAAVNLAASAIDPGEGDLSGSVLWTDGQGGSLGSGASVSVSFAAGVHDVFAGVTDSGGLSDSDSITITVNNVDPVVTITAPSTGSSFNEGGSVQFTAVATDAGEGDLSDNIQWTDDQGGALGSGASISLLLPAGVHTITAGVTDSGGLTGFNTTTVTIVNVAPSVNITSPSGGAIFHEGDVIQFTATASDPGDGDLSGHVQWTDDQGGSLGSGASMAASLPAGTHTITAGVTDAGGLTGSDAVAIEVRPPVSSYPYTEGFESGWGDWVNASGDDMDWTRHSGSTTSSNTGPSAAQGGTYYAYTESSTPNYPDKTAVLEGPRFDLANTSQASLTFWRHMYGYSMGVLYVEVSEDGQNWTTLWSLSGDQGNTWVEEQVDLGAYIGRTISIRFRGVTGSEYASDMSIDDIRVDATPAIPCTVDGDCDDGVFCNGAEACVDSICRPGADPCPGQVCNEDQDLCETVECLVDADCDDGNACTVDACDNGSCTNACPAAVSAWPYTEDFEGGFGDWVNASGDDMNWTQRSGSTPSYSTGPTQAHGGSYYVYTESSSPNYPGKTALLEGPCLDLSNTSQAGLTFWYHMYGSTMGSLHVEVSENCQDWTSVWSLSGDQGNLWREAQVDLSAYVGRTITIRFRGVTGTSYTSDMSIDDIRVDATPAIPCSVDGDCDDGLFCNGPETCDNLICQPGTDPCPGQLCNETQDLCEAVECVVDADCDDGNACTTDLCDTGACVNELPDSVDAYPHLERFETGFGDWGNVTGDDTDWIRRSGSTPSSSTGPSGAQSGVYYAYIEASSPNYPGKTAILESPYFDLGAASQGELTFWYHMYGSSMGTLYVDVSVDCQTWTNVWYRSTNQGVNWNFARIDLSAYGGSAITIRFRGITGQSYTSDIAIDEIVMTAN